MTNTIKISKINITAQILDRDAKDIRLLSKSINEFGLTTPISIDKDNNLISGYIRLEAYKLLGYTEIPYHIVDCESDYQKINLTIDSNLMDKNLSRFEKSKLLFLKKEAYEEKYPTSTKSFKAKNNARNDEKKVVAEKGFFTYMAEKLNCSEKLIRNMVNEYSSIYNPNPELALLLLEYEKTANNKLKGVDIKSILELSPDDMNKLVDDLLEQRKINKKFSMRDLLRKKQDNKISKEEKDLLLEKQDNKISEEAKDLLPEKQDNKISEEAKDLLPEKQDNEIAKEEKDLLPEKQDNKISEEAKDLLPEKQDNKISEEAKDLLVFKLDLLNLLSKDKNHKLKFNEIKIDLEEAKEIKKHSKLNFTNHIKFILDCLK